ncbi:TRAP transporter permease, partial [Citreimonas sp.]|uniref:TRAP transporter permease n=1 Tax=Citreimonas sp. TaxID=3036715 RepID=UPI0035C7C36D
MSLERIQKALAVLVGAFVFYTAATGPFEGLVQRALFLALVACLGFALYPLGRGTVWRPLGLAIDLALAAVTVTACGYVVWNYETIMGSLPWATTLDMALTLGLVGAVLELGRRTVGLIFPVLVVLGLGYALLGDLLPGALGHRGFDRAFVTETIFLGDLGIWGMLTGVASTVIAAFVLFGALLLHTGGGQAFMDFAMRVGGRQPGGAAKIATIASGLFGMISGSAVANVATTGNFTIPMMIRLGYPRPFAAAVEAVASTGGQIAPPIMGAAAFVMAEILGMSYWTIVIGAVLPA